MDAMKLKFVFSHFCLLLAVLWHSNCNAQTNIVQIIADDLGWVDLSSGLPNLGNGSPYYQTPNIDALATGGMSFTSFYAQPSCAPTRAALFTGQYAPRNSVYTVGSLNDNNASLLVTPVNGNGIKTDAVTLGETLQSHGYVTAHIGKFHSTASTADIEAFHGFNFNIGGTTSGGPNGAMPYFAQFNGGQWTFANAHGPELDVYAQPYTQAYIDENLAPFANGNDPSVLVNTPKHLSDAMADAAVDFLQDRVGDSQPFFVNVAFNAVHNEINSRPDLEAKYIGLPGSSSPDHDSPGYAGLLEGMDQAIARIVQFVQANGLGSNTMIVFISDNGATGTSDNFPLSGSKGSFREGGVRVPMIVYQPGTISAGATSDRATHPVDFYKTYAELTGATLPDPAVHPLEGESFSDVLAGSPVTTRQRPVFYHFPGYAQTTPSSIVIHDGDDGNRYKLHYFYEDRSFEFYDLTNDIDESVNLIQSGMTQSQFANAVACSQSLIDWVEDSGADLLTVRATGELVPAPKHTPAIVFPLSLGSFGGTLNGLGSGAVSANGLTMNLTAEGQNGVFEADNNSIGVNSDLDAGNGINMRRIDGSLSTPEGVVVSFDQDVFLKQLDVRGFDSSGSAESLVLEFVSGDNPFGSLSGYATDGFTTSGNSLLFQRSDGGNQNFSVQYGTLAQSEVFLSAGTEVRITANPATTGGVLLASIQVAFPQCPVEAAEVPPNSFTVFRGSPQGGNLASLSDTDGDFLRMNPGFTLNNVEAPVWLIFDGELPSDNAPEIEFAVTAQANTPNITAALEAWNWNTQSYDVVDVTPASFNNNSITSVVLDNSSSDYKQPGTGAVRSRVGWRVTGFILIFPWEVRVDEIEWSQGG